MSEDYATHAGRKPGGRLKARPYTTAYREYAAPVELRHHVECLWSITCDRAMGHPVLPDGCIDVLYSAGQGLRLIGAMSERRDYALEPCAELVGIRFHPGSAARFLGCPMAEFTNRNEPLESIWGRRARDLVSQLENQGRAANRVALLRSVFVGEAPAKTPVEAALDALRTAGGSASVDWLADQAGLSPRQFRRRVVELSGLGPKHLARVLRFRKAAGMGRNAALSGWATIAAECGYFDQAHLIRDFRELGGCTPATLPT